MTFEANFNVTFIVFSQVDSCEDYWCFALYLQKRSVTNFLQNDSYVKTFLVKVSLFRNFCSDNIFLKQLFDLFLLLFFFIILFYIFI